jgi:hypothetical protein
MNRQAGESLEMLGRWREAVEYYEKDGIFEKIIECLDANGAWEFALRTVRRYSSQLTEVNKKLMLKKYCGLTLQELMEEVELENEEGEGTKRKKRVEVIKEQENSDD